MALNIMQTSDHRTINVYNSLFTELNQESYDLILHIFHTLGSMMITSDLIAGDLFFIPQPFSAYDTYRLLHTCYTHTYSQTFVDT